MPEAQVVLQDEKGNTITVPLSQVDALPQDPTLNPATNRRTAPGALLPGLNDPTGRVPPEGRQQPPAGPGGTSPLQLSPEDLALHDKMRDIGKHAGDVRFLKAAAPYAAGMVTMAAFPPAAAAEWGIPAGLMTGAQAGAAGAASGGTTAAINKYEGKPAELGWNVAKDTALNAAFGYTLPWLADTKLGQLATRLVAAKIGGFGAARAFGGGAAEEGAERVAPEIAARMAKVPTPTPAPEPMPPPNFREADLPTAPTKPPSRVQFKTGGEINGKPIPSDDAVLELARLRQMAVQNGDDAAAKAYGKTIKRVQADLDAAKDAVPKWQQRLEATPGYQSPHDLAMAQHAADTARITGANQQGLAAAQKAMEDYQLRQLPQWRAGTEAQQLAYQDALDAARASGGREVAINKFKRGMMVGSSMRSIPEMLKAVSDIRNPDARPMP